MEKQAYLGEEINWLKQYLTMSDADIARDMVFKFPQDFVAYVQNSDEADKLPQEDDPETLVDTVMDMDLSVFSQKLMQGFKEEEANSILSANPADAPSYLTLSYEGMVKNQWLIHFTDDPDGIASSGFKYGMDDMDRVALTTWFSDAAKKSGGFNFAYLLSDFMRYSGARSGSSKYGKHAVLFRASGIRVWHTGDDEPQVIFRGSEARDIVPIMNNYGTWQLPVNAKDRPIYESDDLSDVTSWVVNNWAQYQQALRSYYDTKVHKPPVVKQKQELPWDENGIIKQQPQAEAQPATASKTGSIRFNAPPLKEFYKQKYGLPLPRSKDERMELEWKYDEAVGQVNTLEFPLIVYRALEVPKGQKPQLDGAGVFWTTNPDAADAYWGGSSLWSGQSGGGKKGRLVTITAEVQSENDVDPWQTFVANFENPDEYEVTLRDGAQLKLIKLDDEEPNEVQPGTMITAAGEPWEQNREEYAPYPKIVKDEKGQEIFEQETDEQNRERHKRRQDWEQSALAAISEGRLDPTVAKERGLYMPGQFKPLPQTLYHVTTALSAVQSGGLKTRYQLQMAEGTGLGGGTSMAISFTEDIEIAKGIYLAVVEGKKVASGQLTVPQMLEMAQKGVGAQRSWLYEAVTWGGAYLTQDKDWRPGKPYPIHLQALIEGKKIESSSSYRGKTQEEMPNAEPVGDGWTDAEGNRRWSYWKVPMSEAELRERSFDFYKTWCAARENAGGPLNPLFFSSNVEALGQVPDDQIAILSFTPRPGALGTRESALGEWRTYSGLAVQLQGTVDPYAKTGSLLKKAMYIEVPSDFREGFFREVPETQERFYAYKGRPILLAGETVYFTFDAMPVAECVCSKVEEPNNDPKDQYGGYYKIYWTPKAFKKYAAAAAVTGDNATWKGKPFVMGAASVLDGVIEEVHDFAECDGKDWHHSYIFSERILDSQWAGGQFEEGQYAIFWIDDKGQVRNMFGLPEGLAPLIKQQIKIIHRKGPSKNRKVDWKPGYGFAPRGSVTSYASLLAEHDTILHHPSRFRTNEPAVAESVVEMQQPRLLTLLNHCQQYLKTSKRKDVNMLQERLTSAAENLTKAEEWYADYKNEFGGEQHTIQSVLRFQENALMEMHTFINYISPSPREKQSADRQIYYHGTDIKNLRPILSEGLVPEGKSKEWADDPSAGMTSPSRQAYGGIYLTRNLMTALGAPRHNRSAGDYRMVMVVVEGQPNSLFLDEDSIVSWLDAPFEHGNDSEFLIGEHFMMTLPNAPDSMKQAYADSQQRYVDRVVATIKRRLEESQLTMDANLEKRVRELLPGVFTASITRRTSHAFKSDQKRIEKDGYDARNYDYTRTYRRVMGDDVEVPPKDTVIPTTEQGEAVFRNAAEQLTRTLRSMLRIQQKGGWSFQNARSMQPIGYSGSNKITCVMEIREGRDLMFYYNDPEAFREEKGSMMPIVVHYGTVPEDFKKQWDERMGYKIMWLKPGEQQPANTYVKPEEKEEPVEPTEVEQVQPEQQPQTASFKLSHKEATAQKMIPSVVFDKMAKMNRISQQDAIDRKLFGPVYHGTTEDRREAIGDQGFVVYEGEEGSGDIQHGYQNQAYHEGIPAPVHHLGYGVYFTTVKSIAKTFAGGTTRGMKMYYLDVPRLETINFGAPKTMMKWWISQGYDPELAKKDRVAATKKLTENLKSKYDAVWFKGKGLHKLLDGDQIVVFDPSRVYEVDPSMTKPGDIGSKVQRKADGMKGVIRQIRNLAPDVGQQYYGGATRLLEVKWQKGGTDYNVYDRDVVFLDAKGKPVAGQEETTQASAAPAKEYDPNDPKVVEALAKILFGSPSIDWLSGGEATSWEQLPERTQKAYLRSAKWRLQNRPDEAKAYLEQTKTSAVKDDVDRLKKDYSTGVMFVDTNEALRKRKDDDLDTNDRQTVLDLDEAIESNPLPEATTVYRIVPDNAVMANEGSRFIDRGFVSCTLDGDPAWLDQLAKHIGLKKYDVLIINVPKGTGHLDIGGYQKEIVLGRGYQFKVDKFELDKVNDRAFRTCSIVGRVKTAALADGVEVIAEEIPKGVEAYAKLGGQRVGVVFLQLMEDAPGNPRAPKNSLMVDAASVAQHLQGQGIGLRIYQAGIAKAAELGYERLYEGIDHSPQAASVWEKLKKRYQTDFDDDWGLYYIVLGSTPKTGSEVPKGDVSKLTFETEENDNEYGGWTIRAWAPDRMPRPFAQYEGPVGFIDIGTEGAVIAGPYVYDINVEDAYRGTGLGQKLYDMAIVEAKKRGYKEFNSSIDQTPEAKAAWKRISQRYPVTKKRDKRDKLPYFSIKLAEGFNDEGFWAGEGNAASGVLPICTTTKRICFAWRSPDVHIGDCWGTIGGAVKEGMGLAQSAKAELKEETGYGGGVTMIPAYVFSSGSFSYHNFIGLVGTEFSFHPQSEHHWETTGLEWFTLDEINKMMEEDSGSFHPGLIALFKNSKDIIEKHAGGQKKQASLSDIREIVLDARESVIGSRRAQNGDCEPVSDAVYDALENAGYSPSIAYGYSNGIPHSWVIIDNTYIDATSDQFEDYEPYGSTPAPLDDIVREIRIGNINDADYKQNYNLSGQRTYSKRASSPEGDDKMPTTLDYVGERPLVIDEWARKPWEQRKQDIANAPLDEFDPSIVKTDQSVLVTADYDYFLQNPELINEPKANASEEHLAHPLFIDTDEGLFVFDGNHRTAAAKELGQMIKAYLIDLRGWEDGEKTGAGPVDVDYGSGMYKNFKLELEYGYHEYGDPTDPDLEIDENNWNLVTVRAFDTTQKGLTAQGKYAGSVDFVLRNNKLQSANTEVEPEYRRQGLATAMYMYAEEVVGHYVVPHSDRSPAGFGLWQQKNRPFGKGSSETTGSSEDDLEAQFNVKYPEAGQVVDGRTVLDQVDNMSSIAATFPNYLILDGIREVPFDEFDMPPDVTPRTKQLAEEIKQSGELMPLIVGVDPGGPFIVEGSHRYDALKILGAKSIPAVVVLDLDEFNKTASKTAAGVREIVVSTDFGTAEGYVASTTAEQLQNWLDRFNYTNEELVADIRQYDYFAVLNNINVYDSARGQGHGNDLLYKFLDEAESRGAKLCLLVADTAEEQAKGFNLIQWYENNDFEDIDMVAGGHLMMKVWGHPTEHTAAKKQRWSDEGLLNKSDALKYKRWWESRGHSVLLDKVHGGLYRVQLKLDPTHGKVAKQYGPVYHGTYKWSDNIHNDPKYRVGKFFCTDPLVAQAYGSFVYECYLTINKPFVVDAKNNGYYSIPTPKAMKGWFNGDEVDTDSIVSFAHERGYDGVIIKNVIELHHETLGNDDYIVFKPNQVKVKGIVEPEISPYTANKYHKQELQRRLQRDYKEGSVKTAKTMTMYHGTPHVFNEFAPTTGKRTLWGLAEVTVGSNAYFFTPDYQTAVNWAENRAGNPGNKRDKYVLTCQITMNNPVDFTNPNWIDEDVDVQPLPMGTTPPEHATRTLLEALRAYTEGQLNEQDWKEMGINIDMLEVTDPGMEWKLIDSKPVMDALRFLKYDGAILDEGNSPEFGGKSYCVFSPQQIKILKRTKVAGKAPEVTWVPDPDINDDRDFHYDPNVTLVPIEKIEGGEQMSRQGQTHYAEKVNRFARRMKQGGSKFKAIAVWPEKDGKYQIRDGHHRWLAALKAGVKTIGVHIFIKYEKWEPEWDEDTKTSAEFLSSEKSS